MNSIVLGWVEKLPEIESAANEKFILEAHRRKILALVSRAQELADTAAELRNEAYRESLRLESNARFSWSAEQISKAKE